MAYQIRYTDSSVIKEQKINNVVGSKWIVGFSIAFLIGGILQLESVKNFLIPGNPKVTKAAFSSFTQQLRDGEEFYDAAAVFCRQIIESDTLE